MRLERAFKVKRLATLATGELVRLDRLVPEPSQKERGCLHPVTITAGEEASVAAVLKAYSRHGLGHPHFPGKLESEGKIVLALWRKEVVRNLEVLVDNPQSFPYDAQRKNLGPVRRLIRRVVHIQSLDPLVAAEQLRPALGCRGPFRVSAVLPRQQLRRTLAEVLYVRLGGLPLHHVFYFVDVDGALVAEVVEEVVSLDGVRPALLVAEDEVDPRVQMLANVLALEREAVDPYEFVRAAFRPRGQNHVIDLAPVVLKRSEGELVGVQEDLGDAEHLRHHLLEVSRVRLATLPR
mmetsp:Transcript_14780/g.29430  ORF Transcript_14780/g.29430 Transcript_14780/m.29430 type:complete len:293 (-) Transcript_14780:943-1821(-)